MCGVFMKGVEAMSKKEKRVGRETLHWLLNVPLKIMDIHLFTVVRWSVGYGRQIHLLVRWRLPPLICSLLLLYLGGVLCA
jgi:hypothetical protein